MLLSRRWLFSKVVILLDLASSLLLFAFMDSPSDSFVSSPLNLPVDEDIREIKKKLKRMHFLLHCMDMEGGHKFENVDLDLI